RPPLQRWTTSGTRPRPTRRPAKRPPKTRPTRAAEPSPQGRPRHPWGAVRASVLPATPGDNLRPPRAETHAAPAKKTPLGPDLAGGWGERRGAGRWGSSADCRGPTGGNARRRIGPRRDPPPPHSHGPRDATAPSPPRRCAFGHAGLAARRPAVA